jgi:Predicted ATPase
MQQGLVALRATGAEVFRPYFLALLAQAYEKAGLVAEGLSTLAEALTTADKNGERLYEAELYRLKGELTLQKFSVFSFQFRKSKKQKPVLSPSAEPVVSIAEPLRINSVEGAKGKRQKLRIRNPHSTIRNWKRRRRVS